jgi:hypothetical protein
MSDFRLYLSHRGDPLDDEASNRNNVNGTQEYIKGSGEATHETHPISTHIHLHTYLSTKVNRLIIK